MGRVFIGTFNVASTAADVQLSSAADPRLFAITMKARPANIGNIYVSDDTTTGSTNGFELVAGDQQSWTYHPETVKLSNFWVFGTSSGDKLDFSALMEN